MLQLQPEYVVIVPCCKFASIGTTLLTIFSFINVSVRNFKMRESAVKF